MIDIKKEYLELKAEIEKYNNSYYNEDQSLIPDYEYDKKIKLLEQMEKDHPELKDAYSPTNIVGGVASSKFTKVAHTYPMLSLANTYNMQDLEEFDERDRKITGEKLEYILELKLDGLSISLIYEKGKLVKAVTRGDGKVGEDVTENIMQIDSIPKILKEKIDVEVRGEVVLPIKEFNRINEEREENGEDIFANPRNAAAGTLRQLDSLVVKQRKLDCYLYYLINAESYGITTHLDAIKYIESLGFKTTGIFKKCESIKDFEDRITYWDSARKKLAYETDGLVIKVNEFKYYKELGFTAKSPRWAIAYKFKPDQKETIITSVDFQVGRTGVITPCANFKPVNLSGSIVKRASLHNFDEIKRLGVKIGDHVVIEKAAEIIPQVLFVVNEKRTGNEEKINKPSTCPSCSQKVYTFEDIVAIKCLNPYCPEKLYRYIEYFSSRDCMNIKGLGEKLVRKFVDLGIITNILDIYNLKNFKELIMEQDKMGEKNTNNLLESIEKSKGNSFATVLYSLGIEYIGKTTASLITEHIDNVDDLINASEEELEDIKGIGEKAAKSIIKFFKDENNRRIIESLKELGFNLKQEKEEILENPKITGKSFLATGTLSTLKRNEVKDIVKKNGGTYLSSVSKNLDYLIVGEKAGSKLKRANELGIKILGEEEFLSWLNQ